MPAYEIIVVGFLISFVVSLFTGFPVAWLLGGLSLIFAWNEYLFAATLTSVNARTITTGLAEFVTVTGTNWGQMAAVATISILPALIFLVFVQRYIVTGLTFGAVKE